MNKEAALMYLVLLFVRVRIGMVKGPSSSPAMEEVPSTVLERGGKGTRKATQLPSFLRMGACSWELLVCI